MTTKPKTRKAPAPSPAIDPVFAAIAEHKALTKKSNRLEAAARAARNRAEKRYGEWTRAPKKDEWPGEAIVELFYDRWNHATRAECKAAIRMARTKPTTPAGVAAMITHARREIAVASDKAEDCTTMMTALKTAASALTRIIRTA